jgi:hypothetical protein
LELENEAKAIKRGDGHIPGEQWRIPWPSEKDWHQIHASPLCPFFSTAVLSCP